MVTAFIYGLNNGVNDETQEMINIAFNNILKPFYFIFDVWDYIENFYNRFVSICEGIIEFASSKLIDLFSIVYPIEKEDTNEISDINYYLNYIFDQLSFDNINLLFKNPTIFEFTKGNATGWDVFTISWTFINTAWGFALDCAGIGGMIASFSAKGFSIATIVGLGPILAGILSIILTIISTIVWVRGFKLETEEEKYENYCWSGVLLIISGLLALIGLITPEPLSIAGAIFWVVDAIIWVIDAIRFSISYYS